MEAGGGGDGDPDSPGRRGAHGFAAAGRRRVQGEQHQQQPQQAPKQLIRWERFLPRRCLRVLLVEHDDSTRHIVAALLRKCSYQVTAVADGLKAWEVLKEKQYKIDLVLTEVEMPSLSGIDLLSQITACHLSRNIPVIMMSSQDSVSIVFDCMRKGAVDFLVKPVRRNELRNLWQHVWRKHCSSGNYGLESTNNQTESEDVSRNDAAINRMNGIVNGINTKEVCDEGSDTQSSGSKPETSCQHAKNAEPTVSASKSSMPVEESMEKQYDERENMKNKKLDGPRENKGVSVGRNAASVQDDACSEEHVQNNKTSNAKSLPQIQGRFLSRNDNKDRRPALTASFDLESSRSKPSKEIIDFIGAAGNGECSSVQKDDPRDRFQRETVESNQDTNPATTSGLLSWELSLRGPDIDNCPKQAFQERHILKHSSASAFSRYGKGIPISCQKPGTAQVTLSMITGQRNENLQKPSTGEKDEAPSYPLWRSSSAPGNDSEGLTCRQVSTSENIKDGGPPDDVAQGPSREDPVVSKSSLDKNNHTMVYHSGQIGLIPFPFPGGSIPLQSLCTSYGAILPPLFYTKPSPHGPVTGDSSKDMISPSQINENNKHLVFDHPSTQNHHPFHSEEGKNGEDHRDPRVLVCSSNDPTDQGNPHNKNVNSGIWSSGSGEMTDAVGNSGMVTDNGNDSGFQNRKGIDWDRSRREAALLKFRMKRKDRCFEKKVRYHSRKKLAEQRPRIKGQFVRRSAMETAMTTEEDD